jgi:hypothetical protein
MSTHVSKHDNDNSTNPSGGDQPAVVSKGTKPQGKKKTSGAKKTGGKKSEVAGKGDANKKTNSNNTKTKDDKAICSLGYACIDVSMKHHNKFSHKNNKNSPVDRVLRLCAGFVPMDSKPPQHTLVNYLVKPNFVHNPHAWDAAARRGALGSAVLRLKNKDLQGKTLCFVNVQNNLIQLFVKALKILHTGTPTPFNVVNVTYQNHRVLTGKGQDPLPKKADLVISIDDHYMHLKKLLGFCDMVNCDEFLLIQHNYLMKNGTSGCAVLHTNDGITTVRPEKDSHHVYQFNFQDYSEFYHWMSFGGWDFKDNPPVGPFLSYYGFRTGAQNHLKPPRIPSICKFVGPKIVIDEMYWETSFNVYTQSIRSKKLLQELVKICRQEMIAWDLPKCTRVVQDSLVYWTSNVPQAPVKPKPFAISEDQYLKERDSQFLEEGESLLTVLHRIAYRVNSVRRPVDILNILVDVFSLGVRSLKSAAKAFFNAIGGLAGVYGNAFTAGLLTLSRAKNSVKRKPKFLTKILKYFEVEAMDEQIYSSLMPPDLYVKESNFLKLTFLGTGIWALVEQALVVFCPPVYVTVVLIESLCRIINVIYTTDSVATTKEVLSLFLFGVGSVLATQFPLVGFIVRFILDMLNVWLQRKNLTDLLRKEDLPNLRDEDFEDEDDFVLFNTTIENERVTIDKIEMNDVELARKKETIIPLAQRGILNYVGVVQPLGNFLFGHVLHPFNVPYKPVASADANDNARAVFLRNMKEPPKIFDGQHTSQLRTGMFSSVMQHLDHPYVNGMSQLIDEFRRVDFQQEIILILLRKYWSDKPKFMKMQMLKAQTRIREQFELKDEKDVSGMKFDEKLLTRVTAAGSWMKLRSLARVGKDSQIRVVFALMLLKVLEIETLTNLNDRGANKIMWFAGKPEEQLTDELNLQMNTIGSTRIAQTNGDDNVVMFKSNGDWNVLSIDISMFGASIRQFHLASELGLYEIVSRLSDVPLGDVFYEITGYRLKSNSLKDLQNEILYCQKKNWPLRNFSVGKDLKIHHQAFTFRTGSLSTSACQNLRTLAILIGAGFYTDVGHAKFTTSLLESYRMSGFKIEISTGGLTTWNFCSKILCRAQLSDRWILLRDPRSATKILWLSDKAIKGLKGSEQVRLCLMLRAYRLSFNPHQPEFQALGSFALMKINQLQQQMKQAEKDRMEQVWAKMQTIGKYSLTGSRDPIDLEYYALWCVENEYEDTVFQSGLNAINEGVLWDYDPG